MSLGCWLEVSEILKCYTGKRATLGKKIIKLPQRGAAQGLGVAHSMEEVFAGGLFIAKSLVEQTSLEAIQGRDACC